MTGGRSRPAWFAKHSSRTLDGRCGVHCDDRDAVRDTLCASDEVIAAVEELQFGLSEGPSLAAFTTRRPVLISDFSAPDVATRWPVMRPYDLRHAATSLMLNSGVPATQVAEWAGHSVNVLLRVYAKCVYGQEDAAMRREAPLRDAQLGTARLG